MSTNEWPRLPDGLRIERPLGEDGVFGRVFKVADERFAGQRPLRAVRVLEQTAAVRKARAGLDEQIGLLLNRQLPYLSCLHEVGETVDGKLYIVSDLHDRSFWDELGDVDGKKRWKEGSQRLLRIAEQLLTGLAALHDQRIAHGDIRTKNVFLDHTSGKPDQTQAYWGNAVIGGMTCWSEGKLRDDDANFYRAPEVVNGSDPPSLEADVYALGLVLCELFGGRKANPKRNGSSVEENVPSAATLRLRQANVPRWLCSFVRYCLAEQAKRPKTAGEALREFKRLQEQNALLNWRILTSAATASVVIAVLVLIELHHNSQQSQTRKALEASLSAAQETIKTKDRLIEEKDRVVETQDREIARSRGEPSDRARGTWQETVANVADPDRKLAEAQKKHEELLRSKGPNDPEAKAFAEWLRRLTPLVEKARVWQSTERGIVALVKAAASAPWDNNAVEQAETRMRALQEAAEQWLRWAENPSLSVSDLRERLDLVTDREVQQILKGWLAAMQDRTWILRLRKGKTSPGFSASRLVSVRGDQSAKWVTGAWHQWERDHEHDYANDAPDVTDIQFSWKPGNEMTVMLEAGGTWARLGDRPNLLNDTLRGSLALWYFNWYGYASNADETNWISFEIPNCPGPPQGWKPSLQTVFLGSKP
ncbi:MAG: protein kinase [Planctomycetia bacterium]|nr:protein kinase [Planctomycetia bacterium]